VGKEKIRKEISPPNHDLVLYMEIAMRSCVEVGPGKD
jgi:hypothetical protein